MFFISYEMYVNIVFLTSPHPPKKSPAKSTLSTQMLP